MKGTSKRPSKRVAGKREGGGGGGRRRGSWRIRRHNTEGARMAGKAGAPGREN